MVRHGDGRLGRRRWSSELPRAGSGGPVERAVARQGFVVVQRVQGRGHSLVVPIRKSGLEAGVCPQVHRGSLEHARGVDCAYGSAWSGEARRCCTSTSRDVDVLEHVLEYLHCGAAVVAGARRIKRLFQPVEQEIGLIDVEERIPLFSTQRADIAHIHTEIGTETPGHR